MDIETFENENTITPYCICLDLNNTEYSFYYKKEKNVIEEALELIFEKSVQNEVDIYIHNLNFDGMLLIHYLTSSKFLFKMKSVSTNLYWIKVFHIKSVITFRCSYKIIPLSLRKLGEIEKFPKTDFPYKFVNLNNLWYLGEPPKKEYWESEIPTEIKNNIYDLMNESIKYCLNDIRLLKRCLLNLFKVIKEIGADNASGSISAPSMSYIIFFKKFNKRSVEKKLKINDDEYIRKSYKGGRCEVFGNPFEGEIIKYYDFPGMYGLCMKQKFHYGKSKITTNAGVDDPGFHTITYKSEGFDIPILPSHSSNGKLLFANGINTGTFWFEEILYFIENGGIILEKHHSLVYEKFDFVFDDFVKYFEGIRQKGGYYNVFGKLMINSLYGGMGLKNENFFNYITFSESEFEYICKNFNIYKFYKLNNVFIIIMIMDYRFKKIYKNKIELNKSMRNVSYASAITSKARIKLHKFIKLVEDDGGRLLYTDTDSIFAAYNKNNKNLKIGNDSWIEFYEDGVFASPKSYSLKKKNEELIKIKGVSVKNISFEEFKTSFYSNREIVFNFQKINVKRNFVLTQRIASKNINFEKYDKRIFDDSKKKTSPILIYNTDIQWTT